MTTKFECCVKLYTEKKIWTIHWKLNFIVFQNYFSSLQSQPITDRCNNACPWQSMARFYGLYNSALVLGDDGRMLWKAACKRTTLWLKRVLPPVQFKPEPLAADSTHGKLNDYPLCFYLFICFACLPSNKHNANTETNAPFCRITKQRLCRRILWRKNKIRVNNFPLQ